MQRALLLRLLVLTLLALSTTSVMWVDPAAHARQPRPEAHDLRVSRHSAAGLEYLLVEPSALPAHAELPMVVYLHGRGDRPRVPRTSPFELETPVRFIVPRGPRPFRSGYEWMPVSAAQGESETLLHAIEERTAQLSAAMLEWRRRHPTRGKPIVTGFSQGAILAMVLALRAPESMACAIPMAGWVPPQLVPLSRDPRALELHPPIRVLHGRRDSVLSAARTRRLVDRLERLGYPVTFEDLPGDHRVSARMRVRVRAIIEEALRAMPQERSSAGTT